MENGFARWLVSFLLCFSYETFLFCEETEDWLWEGDTSLVLPRDEPERFISLTGELQFYVLSTDLEDSELDTFDYWILKMNPESFEIACTTPVRAAFQSPESIRSCTNCNELELTGEYDKTWLREHVGQIVTLSGYLRHAHTAHHKTPVIMDTDPWFK